ncbi:MAG: hypothetical protein IPK15_14615 [Verrucomicrobia bacterium]|nr:hypothetical protein [Verrucomicrobiota bacterium]
MFERANLLKLLANVLKAPLPAVSVSLVLSMVLRFDRSVARIFLSSGTALLAIMSWLNTSSRKEEKNGASSARETAQCENSPISRTKSDFIF